jgi:hypothetical protein
LSFVLWHLQTLKMNDKYFRRFRINDIFLWWIFILSVVDSLWNINWNLKTKHWNVDTDKMKIHHRKISFILNLRKYLSFIFKVWRCHKTRTKVLSEYSFWIRIVYSIIRYVIRYSSEYLQIIPILSVQWKKPQINVREYQKDNRIWVQKTKTNKTTTQNQHNTKCAGRHLLILIKHIVDSLWIINWNLKIKNRNVDTDEMKIHHKKIAFILNLRKYLSFIFKVWRSHQTKKDNCLKN